MSQLGIQSLRVGIDPGALYIRAYLESKQEVSEPAVAALDYRSGEVVAVGRAAATRLRQRGAYLRECRPFVAGEVVHYEAARLLLRQVLDTVQKRAVWRPDVCLAVPRDMAPLALRTWTDVAVQAGARSAILVDRGAATALGSDADLAAPTATAAVDLGVGMAAAVTAGGGYLATTTAAVGMGALKERLGEYLVATYDLFTDDELLRFALHGAASATAADTERAVLLRGRLQADGTQCMVTLTAQEILPLVTAYLDRLAVYLRHWLARVSPQAQADIYRNGVILTGGGSLLDGIEGYLTAQLGVAVQASPNPFGTVAKGALKALQRSGDWPYLLASAMTNERSK